MTIWEAMEERHTVRHFTDEAVDEEALSALSARIDALNVQFGLDMSLHVDEELQLWPGMTLFSRAESTTLSHLRVPTAVKAPNT